MGSKMPLLWSKFLRTLQLVLDAAVNFRRMPINGDDLASRSWLLGDFLRAGETLDRPIAGYHDR